MERMERQNEKEIEAELQGQAHIWQYVYRSVESMAVKCAVELHIPDIINSRGRPLTLSEIATDINSPTLDITYLFRIMRFLVYIKIFDSKTSQSNAAQTETFYSLNNSSRWLLHDAELSLVPMIFLVNNSCISSPFYYLSRCVKEGVSASTKAHGLEMWDLASVEPEFNRIFNEGMACTSKIVTKAIILAYKDGFNDIESLVDVGGGTGAAAAAIVKAYPHIRLTNFDLPHVVATAPTYTGVTHVGGDMFKAIPSANAILIKWVMHNWSDEDCIKILKNCRQAIQGKIGKVVIVDAILQPESGDLFESTRMVLDIVMLALFSGQGGKERTEDEWKIVLERGGFPHYKIIKIPALLSVIEAYPK